MEHCIVYFSQSVSLFQDEDIAAILRQSRQNNARFGITGLLLYVRGNIIQVLEGDQETVEALYKRIEADGRHRKVTRVFNQSISQRLFTNWTMGYETLSTSQLDTIKTIANFYNHEGIAAEVENSIILKTINVFYESNRRS